MLTAAEGKEKSCIFADGKLPEWSNGADSKSVDPFGGPGVRIPYFPQNCRKMLICSILRQFFKTAGTATGSTIPNKNTIANYLEAK